MEPTSVLYQLRIELWNLLYTNWKSDIMTIQFWGLVGFILFYYAMWWSLTDKRRLSDLLLFGSFVAVMRFIIDLLGVTSGSFYYSVGILPTGTGIFLQDITISPLTHMLAQQHSPSWRRFFVLGAVAAAVIHFIIMPAMTFVGIFHLVKWSHLYGFITSYGIAIASRGVFHFVKQVQNKATQGEDSPIQDTLMHPAFKPLQDNNKEDDH